MHPSQKRIPPRSNRYHRRQRLLHVIVPASVTVLCCIGFWWLAGLPSPWEYVAERAAQHRFEDPEAPLLPDERKLLEAQLLVLRGQAQRLALLKSTQAPVAAHPLPEPEPSLLRDADLRSEIERLVANMDQQLADASPLAHRQKTGIRRILPDGEIKQSSGFGLRIDPFNNRLSMHEGLDFIAPIGTPVHAAEAGSVRMALSLPQYGGVVEVLHANGLSTRYAHLLRILVKSGQTVQEGQIVGEVGNTGRSTGTHLHFEVRFNGVPLNPDRYLALR